MLEYLSEASDGFQRLLKVSQMLSVIPRPAIVKICFPLFVFFSLTGIGTAYQKESRVIILKKVSKHVQLKLIMFYFAVLNVYCEIKCIWRSPVCL